MDKNVYDPPETSESAIKPDSLPEPVNQKSRIASIDVLRGFALLGILVMNVQSFGLIGAMYMNPNAMGPMNTVDTVIWRLGYFLFDTKMMSIFSMLFGAGIVLMWERSKKIGRSFTGRHYIRMVILLLFGLAHAHLIWPGDILFMYAVTGMIVYWLSGLSWKWLVPIGVISILFGAAVSIGMGTMMSFAPADDIAQFRSEWAPDAEKIQKEIATYRGGYLDHLPLRSTAALMMELFLFPLLIFWRCAGLMLIGMALFKTGVLSAQKSRTFYITGAIVGFVLGQAFIVTGLFSLENNNWEALHSMFIGTQWNIVGSPLISFSYICLVMLFCQSSVLRWLKESLAAVGQMALTNYLMQSILCTVFFYGHGLGYFASLDRLQMLILVASIWALQLAISPVWLSYFKFGPFEWLWRSLSYWKIQPMMRT